MINLFGVMDKKALTQVEAFLQQAFGWISVSQTLTKKQIHFRHKIVISTVRPGTICHYFCRDKISSPTAKLRYLTQADNGITSRKLPGAILG
jgi:hypothetical protein